MALSRNSKDTRKRRVFEQTSAVCCNRIIASDPDNMPIQQQPQSTATFIQFYVWRPTLASVWACHFAASISIILWGSIRYYDDRKYIPIDRDTVDDQCSKAYANVLASSVTENGAIVCCTPEYTDGICGSSPWYLLFAQRLARLPEAWVLPLFPLMVRAVVQFARRQQRGSNTTNGKTWRRLYLYIGLIQIRGWILYLLFDKVEDLVVQPAGHECWYDKFLRSHQNPCQGKATDYSDHIVLFFSQILPIPLTEVLISFEAPYWRNHSFLRKAVPTILLTGLLYLYLISFLATYKTSAYFHTLYEVAIGYLISLLIQIPLFLIVSTSIMEPIRDYFFDLGS